MHLVDFFYTRLKCNFLTLVASHTCTFGSLCTSISTSNHKNKHNSFAAFCFKCTDCSYFALLFISVNYK